MRCYLKQMGRASFIRQMEQLAFRVQQGMDCITTIK